jgi:hypothetical protein
MNLIGAVIVACFAVVWVAAGTHTFRRPWFGLSLAVSMLISLLIIYAAARGAPRSPHGASFNGPIYGIFVTLEVLFIVIAVVIINRSGRKQYLIPVIAFIVGAHFFGMVPALHSSEFWWIGGAMCLLPVITVSALSQNLWEPVVGVGCAAILWLSVLSLFFIK